MKHSCKFEGDTCTHCLISLYVDLSYYKVLQFCAINISPFIRNMKTTTPQQF